MSSPLTQAPPASLGVSQARVNAFHNEDRQESAKGVKDSLWTIIAFNEGPITTSQVHRELQACFPSKRISKNQVAARPSEMEADGLVFKAPGNEKAKDSIWRAEALPYNHHIRAKKVKIRRAMVSIRAIMVDRNKTYSDEFKAHASQEMERLLQCDAELVLEPVSI